MSVQTMNCSRVDLCDYEVKILRVCAGEAVNDVSWGAAMAQALECLKGLGLARLSAGEYTATEKGRAWLAGCPGG